MASSRGAAAAAAALPHHCGLCSALLDRDLVVTRCGHIFHKSCLYDYWDRGGNTATATGERIRVSPCCSVHEARPDGMMHITRTPILNLVRYAEDKLGPFLDKRKAAAKADQLYQAAESKARAEEEAAAATAAAAAPPPLAAAERWGSGGNGKSIAAATSARRRKPEAAGAAVQIYPQPPSAAVEARRAATEAAAKRAAAYADAFMDAKTGHHTGSVFGSGGRLSLYELVLLASHTRDSQQKELRAQTEKHLRELAAIKQTIAHDKKIGAELETRLRAAKQKTEAARAEVRSLEARNAEDAHVKASQQLDIWKRQQRVINRVAEVDKDIQNAVRMPDSRHSSFPALEELSRITPSALPASSQPTEKAQTDLLQIETHTTIRMLKAIALLFKARHYASDSNVAKVSTQRNALAAQAEADAHAARAIEKQISERNHATSRAKRLNALLENWERSLPPIEASAEPHTESTAVASPAPAPAPAPAPVPAAASEVVDDPEYDDPEFRRAAAEYGVTIDDLPRKRRRVPPAPPVAPAAASKQSAKPKPRVAAIVSAPAATASTRTVARPAKAARVSAPPVAPLPVADAVVAGVDDAEADPLSIMAELLDKEDSAAPSLPARAESPEMLTRIS